MPLKGIQLNPALGNVFLVLALLSLLGLLAALGWIFIPWIRNLWAGIKKWWPFALARTVRHLGTELREARDRNEQLDQLHKNLQTERDQLFEVLQDTKRELKRGERRKRIEKWRSVICDFDFHAENFASTDTYFEMEQYLLPEVVEMFKRPRTVHIGNEVHGDLAYKPALLREVTRIEGEWGLL